MRCYTHLRMHKHTIISMLVRDTLWNAYLHLPHLLDHQTILRAEIERLNRELSFWRSFPYCYGVLECEEMFYSQLEVLEAELTELELEHKGSIES